MKKYLILLGAFFAAFSSLSVAQSIFSDSFDTNQGWSDSDKTNDLKAIYTIVNGEYLINPLQNNTFALAISPAKIDNPDVVIETDLRLAASLPESRAGIACRVSKDMNFYAFVLAAKGTYEIVRVQNGKGTVLDSGTTSTNAAEGVRMRVECVGSNFSLQINGQELGKASDTTLNNAGKVGLVSLSPVTAATNAAFDNFSIVSSDKSDKPTAKDSNENKNINNELIPTVDDSVLHNDANGKPNSPQSLFSVGNHKIYIVLTLTSNPTAHFRAVWKAIKGSEETVVLTSNYENIEGSKRVWLYAQRNWSAGLYRVDVYANNQLVTQTEFSVY